MQLFLPVSYSSFKLVGSFHCLKLLFVTLCKTTWLELKLHTYSGCVLFLSTRRTIHCHTEYFPQWNFHSHFPVRMVWKWNLWCDWMGEWKGQRCVRVSLCVCLCVCVCICVGMHLYVSMCVHNYVSACVDVCMHTFVNVCVRALMLVFWVGWGPETEWSCKAVFLSFGQILAMHYRK